jgi:WD40 repeat protein
MRILALLGVAVSIAGTSVVQAQDAPSEMPIPRIETGMHVAPVIRIGVDRDCKLMVTGSKDKTARLWALPSNVDGDAELVQTFRVPLGDGDQGKVFAVAISPNGRLVAVGGWDVFQDQQADHAIYVFEVKTGTLLRRITGLGSVIRQLVFSPDSTHLAATLSDRRGLKIWSTTNWQVIAEDTDYASDSYGSAFDTKGQLYTVAFDGFVRRYGPNFKLEMKSPSNASKRPFTVAVHPSGEFLAVGYDRSTPVEIYDAVDLKLLYAANTTGLDNGDLNSVAWSSDGTRLYAAGKYTAGPDRMVRIWDKQGRGEGQSVAISRYNIDHLLPCGANIAVGADDPAFGLINAAGDKVLWRESVIVDMREKVGRNFTLSHDGTKVRFGLGIGGERPVLFDIVTGRLSDALAASGDLAAADTQSLAVTDWKNTLTPQLAGKALAMQSAEYARSLAIAPRSESFVLGAEWHLRAFASNGESRWVQSVPAGVAWGVHVSGDGRFVVAAYGDGTIRWHRLDNGEELLALFVNAKNREWALWTPQGYYASSPNGDRYIGWHMNKGWDAAGEFVTADQLKKHFYRPDIIRRVVAMANTGTALAEAGVTGFKLEDLVRRQPPDFTIVDPKDKSSVRGSIEITLEIANNKDAVSGIEVTVNGRRAPPPEIGGINGTDAKTSIKALISLENGENRIRFIAANAIGETVRELLLFNEGESLSKKRGKLIIVAVGVDKYPKLSPKDSLRYAGADARAVLEALVAKAGPLHESVLPTLLVSGGDTPPTRANVQKALGVFAKAQVEDTVVLFLAGHGVNDGPDYLFLPEDATWAAGGSWRPASVLKWQALQLPLQKARGRRIMLVDTCHSGGAYNARLIKDATDANIVVFSATDVETEAQEIRSVGHGVFSYALVQGLRGGADVYKNGSINILELGGYVSHEVKRLTNGAQEPTFNLAGSRNFVLSVH